MKNSFKEVASENINPTRNFGGSNIVSADPYTTGTFFIWFGRLPAALPSKLTTHGSSGISSNDQIRNILAALCNGVTPPGGTLNRVEHPGMGGNKWGTPGSIEYGTTITLKFEEMSGVPVLDIVSNWFKLIRDKRTGFTPSASGMGDVGGGFSQRNYAGTLLYWTATPDATQVEMAAAYDGLWPTKDPLDTYSSDIETIEKLDVEIEFNVNRVYREPWVYDACQRKMQYFVDGGNDFLNRNFAGSFGG